MTIIMPKYARHRPLRWWWVGRRRVRSYLHGLKRNPQCNERRRYRDDTTAVGGVHKHAGLLTFDGRVIGETLTVPFEPFRISSDSFGSSREEMEEMGWTFFSTEDQTP